MCDSLTRIKAKGKLTVKMVDKALSWNWITTEEALILKEGLS